jgi:hypothetical protein
VDPSQPPPKRKLAVVCCSGGGTLAALWSAKVLSWLDAEMKDQHFRESLRLISAGSAGSVGAAHYVKWVYDHCDVSLTPEHLKLPQSSDWLQKIPRQSLLPVSRSIALRELWRMFASPVDATPMDRGEVLETDWAHLRELPLEELRLAERRGLIPSLVTAPVILEDGRRLLISNLDLASYAFPDTGNLSRVNRNLSVHRGCELIFPRAVYDLLKSKTHQEWEDLIFAFEFGLEYLPDEARKRAKPGGQGRGQLTRQDETVFSVTAYEFSKLFRREKGFRLATAARMSATVPFITPSVYLPTRPAVRVIDAGYRDNFGVDLATSWIFQNHEWLRKNTTGVVLIQLRALGDPEARLQATEPRDAWARATDGFQFFTSVPEAAAKAFSTSAIIRNDQVIGRLARWLNDPEHGGAPEFFTTVVFELPATVRSARSKAKGATRIEWPKVPRPDDPRNWSASQGAVSWFLTAAEEEAILEHALPDDALATVEKMADPEGTAGRRQQLDLLRTEVGKESSQAAPDPRRHLTLLWEYERALNYERLQSLKRWWAEPHSAAKTATVPVIPEGGRP